MNATVERMVYIGPSVSLPRVLRELGPGWHEAPHSEHLGFGIWAFPLERDAVTPRPAPPAPENHP